MCNWLAAIDFDKHRARKVAKTADGKTRLVTLYCFNACGRPFKI